MRRRLNFLRSLALAGSAVDGIESADPRCSPKTRTFRNGRASIHRLCCLGATHKERPVPWAPALCALLLAGPMARAEAWQACGWGGGGFYFSAVFHPARPGTIYLGGDVNGVYKTEDHGQHWRIVNRGLANYAIYSLAVDRTHPDTVYAATPDGLCKSVDAGEQWSLLPRTGPGELRITGERGKSVRAIAVDPTDGNVLYAATPGGRVLKSTDGGQSWNVVYAAAAEADSVDHARVQFGRINDQWHGGLLLQRATTGVTGDETFDGVGFTFRGGGTPPRDCFLTLQIDDGTRYRSRNIQALFANTAWQDVVLRDSDFAIDAEYAKQHPDRAAQAPAAPAWPHIQRMDFVCVGSLPETAAVARFGRVFLAGGRPTALFDAEQLRKAVVYGNAYIGAARGGTIYSVAVASKHPAIVFAATDDAGVLRSQDAGRTWHTLPTPRQVACVTVAENDAAIVYAACFKSGVWKSTDQGLTWQAMTNGIARDCAVREVAVHPADPLDIVAIGAADWNGYCYRSRDGGSTWSNVSELAVDRSGNPTVLQGGDSQRTRMSAPTNVSFNPRDPRELFISANWRPCWSGDGGCTWEERDRGADISCVYDIRFHNGKTYAAAMDEGAFVSADAGTNWQQVAPTQYDPSLNGHCWQLAVTGDAGSERILATFSPWWQKYPPRLVVSRDGGRTHRVVTSGLPDHVLTANTMWGQGHPRALVVDPRQPQTAYLGIDGDPDGGRGGGGIFKSTDGGETWRQLERQPGSRRIFFGLAIDPTDSKRLYWAACGAGGGLYRSEDGGETWDHIFKEEGWPFNVMVTPDGTVYVPGRNLWRSRDHGRTWKKLTAFPDDGGVVVGLAYDPEKAQRLWCSVLQWGDRAAGGVYRTVDDGATWQEITGDLPHRKPLVLRYDAATRQLWAGGVGLYRLSQ